MNIEKILNEKNHIIFYNSHNKDLYKHIRKYADDNQLYIIEIDEFNDEYIKQLVDTYKLFADEDEILIYVKLHDAVDYNTANHQYFMYKLVQYTSHKYKIIIDYHTEYRIVTDFIAPIKDDYYELGI